MGAEEEVLAPLLRTSSRLRQKPQTYLTDAGKVKVDTLRRQRRRGVITDEELLRKLDELGMPAELAEAIVENERLRAEEIKGG